jgi:glutamate/tyrosine decarboxylase-like PLP-dependent enzyme
MTGSRPGGSIAGAWATLVHIGTAGYLKKAQQLHTLFTFLTTEFRLLMLPCHRILTDNV